MIIVPSSTNDTKNSGARKGWARDHLRGAEVGYIFQMFNLLPAFTALENVCAPCFFSAAKRQRVQAQGMSVAESARQLLSALQLDPQAMAAQSVSRLSVGQQQRVAAARALIGVPPPPPNLIVYVKLRKAIPYRRAFNPAWVSGIIYILDTQSQFGTASWRMDGIKIAPYLP